MKQKAKETVKIKASEKLKALEQQVFEYRELLMNSSKRVGELELVVYNQSRQLEMMGQAVTLMNQKLEAVIGLLDNPELSDDSIEKKIVSDKISNMESNIKQLVDQGALVGAEEIGEDSYVIGREISKEDGSVENPRIEFMISKIQIDELKNKLLGKKVNELVKGEENRLDLEVVEIYNIVAPEPTQEPDQARAVLDSTEPESNEEESETQTETNE